MIRAFDIETNGLPYKLEQKGIRPVVLSVGIVTGDKSLTPIDRKEFYFWKDDYVLDEEAIAINGLTEDILKPHAEEFDKNVIEVLSLINNCQLILKNGSFDTEIFKSWASHYFPEFLFNFGGCIEAQSFCSETWRQITDPSNTISASGRTRKGTLTDWYRDFKLDRFMNANLHTACDDAEATMLACREVALIRNSKNYRDSVYPGKFEELL